MCRHTSLKIKRLSVFKVVLSYSFAAMLIIIFIIKALLLLLLLFFAPYAREVGLVMICRWSNGFHDRQKARSPVEVEEDASFYSFFFFCYSS